MIITELTGGLGNQLFQLSNGLVIAKNNDVVFHAPNYSENIKTIQQYSQFAEEYRDTIFRNIPNLDVQPINVQMQVVNNQQQHFQYIQPPYHENYINIYKGYFQSEKFFQNQEELLKNYFHNQDLINKFQYIKNLNYASLHIKFTNAASYFAKRIL